jgi:hypothetical protein
MAASVGLFSNLAGTNPVTYNLCQIFSLQSQRFYLGPLLNAAGLRNRDAQLVINIALSAWFFMFGLIGTIIVEKVPRRTLFSTLPAEQILMLDTSNICMIPLLVLVGILTKGSNPLIGDLMIISVRVGGQVGRPNCYSRCRIYFLRRIQYCMDATRNFLSP